MQSWVSVTMPRYTNYLWLFCVLQSHGGNRVSSFFNYCPVVCKRIFTRSNFLYAFQIFWKLCSVTCFWLFTVFIRKLMQQNLSQSVALLKREPRPPNTSSSSDTHLPASVLMQFDGHCRKKEPLFAIFAQCPSYWEFLCSDVTYRTT